MYVCKGLSDCGLDGRSEEFGIGGRIKGARDCGLVAGFLGVNWKD